MSHRLPSGVTSSPARLPDRPRSSSPSARRTPLCCAPGSGATTWAPSSPCARSPTRCSSSPGCSASARSSTAPGGARRGAVGRGGIPRRLRRLCLRRAARPASCSGQAAARVGAAGARDAAALTWLNPHVYLDTVLLVGSLANQHGADGRWWFAAGAVPPASRGSPASATARGCSRRSSPAPRRGGCSTCDRRRHDDDRALAPCWAAECGRDRRRSLGCRRGLPLPAPGSSPRRVAVSAPARSRARRTPAPLAEPTPEQRRRERRQRPRAMSLTELAEEFGTDKWGVHRYTPHYERHLEHLRDASSRCSRSASAATTGAGAGVPSCRCGAGSSRGRPSWASTSWTSPSWTTPRSAPTAATRPTPDFLRASSTSGASRGRHRRRQPRAGPRPRDLRGRLPAAAGRRDLRIEDTQTSYWPAWGGQLDPRARGPRWTWSRTSSTASTTRSSSSRATSRPTPTPTCGRCTATTTSWSSRRATTARDQPRHQLRALPRHLAGPAAPGDPGGDPMTVLLATSADWPAGEPGARPSSPPSRAGRRRPLGRLGRRGGRLGRGPTWSPCGPRGTTWTGRGFLDWSRRSTVAPAQRRRRLRVERRQGLPAPAVRRAGRAYALSTTGPPWRTLSPTSAASSSSRGWGPAGPGSSSSTTRTTSASAGDFVDHPTSGGPRPWIAQPLVESVRTVGEPSVFVLDGVAVSQATSCRAATRSGSTSTTAASRAPVARRPELAELAPPRRGGRATSPAGLSTTAAWTCSTTRASCVSELEVTEPGLYLDVLPANAAPSPTSSSPGWG